MHLGIVLASAPVVKRFPKCSVKIRHSDVLKLNTFDNQSISTAITSYSQMTVYKIINNICHNGVYKIFILNCKKSGSNVFVIYMRKSFNA